MTLGPDGNPMSRDEIKEAENLSPLTAQGMRQLLVEELRWKKFPVLDDGHVCLVDVMGDDAAVVQAARVSYGEGTKKVSNDRTLIRYLMRHRHSTPFEMCEVKLRVRVPMDTWRQWIRHRTANVNEYSTRYSVAIDARQATKPEEWRLQSGSNKQGSEGYLGSEDDAERRLTAESLTNVERWFHNEAQRVYNERLASGVAREQARKDLPLSTYTEAYWKIDLHNLLHFLSLRMDPHAQKEIRDYATVIGDQIVKPLFPIVWEAFEDYRLGAVNLTRLDALVIAYIAGAREGMREIAWQEVIKGDAGVLPEGCDWDKEKCRERDECRAKLERLGIL
jgi:thymidylate synthase (FAD)